MPPVSPSPMTEAERFAAVKAGRRPDRVPLAPFVQAYAARIMGVPLARFYAEPELSIRAQTLAAEMHGYIPSPSFGWADWGAWEFGGSLRWPQSHADAAPRTEVSPVQKPSDVDRIEVPDPAVAGMYPLLMAFNRLLVDMGRPAKIAGGAVTNVAAAMLGRENLLRWYHKEPAAVHAAYDKAAGLIIKGADLVIDTFGTGVNFGYGAPLDANDLISPRIFETFAWPRLKRVHEAVLARGVTSFGVHLCGNHTANLPAWVALPWPARTQFSIGSTMDLARTAEAFGHRQIIAGNVCTTILARGTYDEVTAEARRCIDEGRDLPGGFVLMPACEMPVMTPPLNVHALLRAVETYGRYEGAGS